MNDKTIKPTPELQLQTDTSQAKAPTSESTRDPELNSDWDNFKQNIKKFLPYLDELRSRIYHGVILFIAVFVIGFLSTRMIIKNVLEIFYIDKVTIAASSPFQFIEVSMNMGYFLAIAVSVPYILYSFYTFTMPGLNREEKIHLIKSVPLTIILFLVGFSYGLIILYYALGILATINIGLGISNFWNISQFLSQMLITSALLGLIFQFPIVLILLLKLGITTPQTLIKHRKIAYILALFATALLPPTDIISLIAMTLPLVLLYEGTILLTNKNINK